MEHNVWKGEPGPDLTVDINNGHEWFAARRSGYYVLTFHGRLAPEWMSEKALAIGAYCAASGVYVLFGVNSPVEASEEVTKIMSEGWEKITGGKMEFVPDMDEIVRRSLAHIDAKRKALKLAPRPLTEYVPATGLKSLGCGHAQKHSQERVPEA